MVKEEDKQPNIKEFEYPDPNEVIDEEEEALRKKEKKSKESMADSEP